jgi:hypothetical protein
MAGTGIRSFSELHSQMPQIATTGIVPWHTALKWTADSALRLPGIHAVRSNLWQSALKFILLSVAIRVTVILFVAILSLNAADCHNPRRTFERGIWQ